MSSEIRVELCLFARLREMCEGQSRLPVKVPAGATPESCFDGLRDRFPALGSQRRGLAVAVNEEYAEWDRPLADGDEVSFIPPVSGG